jgi:hypothetical protein
MNMVYYGSLPKALNQILHELMRNAGLGGGNHAKSLLIELKNIFFIT